MAKKPPVNSYLLRLPDPLRAKLEKATERSGRTLRAEIIERLEQTFADQQADQADQGLAARVDQLEQQLVDQVRDLQRRVERIEGLVIGGSEG